MSHSGKLLEMRQSNRRQILKMMGVAGAASLAGCTGDDGGGSNEGGNGGSGGAIEIRVITDHSSPEKQELLRNSFDAWAETVDENVERSFIFRGFDEVIETLNNGFATDNPPNLAFLNVGSTARYASEGQLADLTELVEKHDQPEEFRLNDPDGNEVFMPHDIGINTKWHHGDVYEDAGVEPASTYEEELENAQDLDEHLEDSNMDPALILANGNTGVTNLNMGNYLLNNGVSYIENNDGEVSVVLDQEPNKERAIVGLEHLREMYQYSPNSETYEYSENIEVNLAGQVAWSTYTGRLMTQALQQDFDGLGSTIDAMPYPIGPDNEDGEYRVNSSVGGFVVPDGNDHIDLVRDYIDFFYSEGWYIDSMLSVPLHNIPPNLDMLDHEKFQENEFFQHRDDIVEYYQEYGQKIKNPMYFTDPPTPFWMDLVENSMIGSRVIAEVVTETKEPGQAIDDAAEDMRELLPNYQ